MFVDGDLQRRLSLVVSIPYLGVVMQRCIRYAQHTYATWGILSSLW